MPTTFELNFVRQNYLTMGITDCAKHLHRSRSFVIKYAKSLGLAFTHKHRSDIMKRKLNRPFDKRNVNPTQFILPEHMTDVNAYLLGFIWADGHVSFRNSACLITANFVNDDSLDILPLFLNTGKWSVYIRPPNNCRESTIVTTNNRPIAEFLNSMDYITKSTAPATKIINFIPEHLRRYWWLGYIDGDGCFTVGNHGHEIQISSSYEQNWEHFKILSESIGINYYSEQRVHKKGRSSAIRILTKESCSKFIKYLYPNGYEFGLRRKFDKAMKMLTRCESTRIKCDRCNVNIYLKSKSDVICENCNTTIHLTNHIKSRIK